MIQKLQQVVCLFFMLLCHSVFGATANQSSKNWVNSLYQKIEKNPSTMQSNREAETEWIRSFYQKLQQHPVKEIDKRLAIASEALLGIPYAWGALGEGAIGKYDQFPIYRLDAFDCETYVDTVLALALAENFETFKRLIRQIRYKDSTVTFLQRNHFLSLDWIPNNQKSGLIKEYSYMIKDSNDHPLTQTAKALIDKPSWYQHIPLERIRLLNPNAKLQMTRWNELKGAGKKLPKAIATLPYIPFTVLFDQQGKPNHALFKQIPNGAIIIIVRPNWNLKNVIGTNLNASHLGFAFWIKGKLIFREASTLLNKTVDVSLIDYLKEALNSPTIKGINIQVVVPSKPFERLGATT